MEGLKILNDKLKEAEVNTHCVCYIEELDEIKKSFDKYQKIEQELGIPLEVLFKALKDGIYYDYDGDKIEFSYVDFFCDEDGEWTLVTDYEFIKTKNYGKTWWLEIPKEELGNAED